MRNLLILTILLSSFTNCKDGQAAEDLKILQQAAAIHLDAIKVQEEIAPKLYDLVQQKNSINIQARVLTDEELTFVEKVGVIEESYDWFEKNHLEVPGFEHAHSHEGHSHDHNHDHGSSPELPPKDILRIQQEFRDSIIAIKNAMNELSISN